MAGSLPDKKTTSTEATSSKDDDVASSPSGDAAGDVDPPSQKPATDDVDGSWDEPIDPAVAPTLPADGEATSVDHSSSGKPAAPPRPAGFGVRPPTPRASAPGLGKTAELGARPGGTRSRPLHLEDSDDPDDDPQTATKTRDDVLSTLTARTNVVPQNPGAGAGVPQKQNPGVARTSPDETTTRAVPSDVRSAAGSLAEPPAELLDAAPSIGGPTPANGAAKDANDDHKGKRPQAVTALSARPPAVTAKRAVPEPGGIAPRPMPPGTTADNLSAEDEDGPTMVVRSYPQAAPDDEATQVHPQRSFSSDSQIELPPLSPMHAMAHMDPDPLPVPPSGPMPFMEGLAIAQRQAAVDAALAAAMGSSEAAEELHEQRERTLELTTASLLGLGLTLTAFASYLSASAMADAAASRAASYGGLTVFGALALFSAGLSTLQRRQNARLACLVGAALLLIFTLTRLIVIAAS